MKKVVFADFVEYNCKTSKLGNYHLCNCFVNDGYEALWLSNAFNPLIWVKDKEDYALKKKLSKPAKHMLASNIYGFAPWSWRLYGNYPFSRDPNIVRNFSKYVSPNFKGSMRKIGFEKVDVLWVSNPKFFWLPQVIEYNTLIYRIADDYAKFKEFPGVEALEKEFIKKADHVVITTELLAYKALDNGKTPLLIKNAVPVEHFDQEDLPCPKELKNDRKKIIYIGAIQYWFDIELVKKMAQQVDADLYLIGKSGIDLAALAALDNVKILGPRTYDEIPAYLKHGDVAVIPFVKGELTDAISPLKLFEYCSAGIPVVSTDMEEVKKIGAPIALAKDHETFIGAVKRYLEEGCNTEELVAFGRANSWKGRYQLIQEVMNGSDA